MKTKGQKTIKKTKSQASKAIDISNQEISLIFKRVATLLELQGANPFRVRAYRNASWTLENWGTPLAQMWQEGQDLTELPGIGKDLAEKIGTILQEGSLPMLRELEKTTSSGLTELARLPGLGPKKIKILAKELGIKNIQDLQKAAKENRLLEVEGFAHKTQEKILEHIEQYKKNSTLGQEEQRLQRVAVSPMVETLINYVKKIKGVKRVEAAGSFRRKKETVGDVDLLVAFSEESTGGNTPASDKIMRAFEKFPRVREVLSQGDKRSTVLMESGTGSTLQVDLRLIPEESWGAAFLYFTGSKEHNIELRRRAQEKKLKLNEYGVFKGKKRVAGLTEDEIYSSLDLPYIPPELRENRGEIISAERKELPQIIEVNDIIGDLHAHTTYTDGSNSIWEMAEAARKLGRKYQAITDHSQKVTVAHGLKPDEVLQQLDEIDEINDRYKKMNVDFLIIKGIEVDILEDGKLDLPNSVLKRLEIRVCSIHFRHKMNREQMTKRILRAMENPYFNILGHPMGRLIGKRGPFDVDMEKVLVTAKERGCFVEINGRPERLDLNEVYGKLAKDIGVKVSISSDAHSILELKNMHYGVAQARRSWLEKGDVVNTMRWEELKQLL